MDKPPATSCRPDRQSLGDYPASALARPLLHPRHQRSVDRRAAHDARVHSPLPEDIAELFPLVGGARPASSCRPVKLGQSRGRVYVEVHETCTG